MTIRYSCVGGITHAHSFVYNLKDSKASDGVRKEGEEVEKCKLVSPCRALKSDGK